MRGSRLVHRGNAPSRTLFSAWHAQMKTFRSTCFAMLMWVGGSAHAVNASDLARVVAPASLMAAYTCATYAEAAFAVPLALRLQQQPSAPPYTAVAMKDLLTRFDAIVAEFCDAVDAALITHEDVLDLRRQPGDALVQRRGLAARHAEDELDFVVHQHLCEQVANVFHGDFRGEGSKAG